MALNDSNTTDQYDNVKVSLYVDNNAIGRVNDRLKVAAQINSTPSNIAYEDAQLTRDTAIVLNTWVTVYSYSGSGYFYGSIINLEGASGAEGDRWFIRVVTDGREYLFGENGIRVSDMTSQNVYDLESPIEEFCGIGMHGNTFRLQLDNSPMKFDAGLSIEIYRTLSVKKFRAGLIKISKD